MCIVNRDSIVQVVFFRVFTNLLSPTLPANPPPSHTNPPYNTNQLQPY